MLTGTPIHNTFADLTGQTMLLLGGGFFTSSDHFHHLFFDQKNSEPQGYKRQLYCRFYQGLIVARPKHVVKLCAKVEYNSEYTSTQRMWTLLIASKVRKAKFIMRQKLETYDAVQ